MLPNQSEYHQFDSIRLQRIDITPAIEEIRQEIQGYKTGLAPEKFPVSRGMISYHGAFPFPATFIITISSKEHPGGSHLFHSKTMYAIREERQHSVMKSGLFHISFTCYSHIDI